MNMKVNIGGLLKERVINEQLPITRDVVEIISFPPTSPDAEATAASRPQRIPICFTEMIMHFIDRGPPTSLSQ